MCAELFLAGGMATTLILVFDAISGSPNTDYTPGDPGDYAAKTSEYCARSASDFNHSTYGRLSQLGEEKLVAYKFAGQAVLQKACARETEALHKLAKLSEAQQVSCILAASDHIGAKECSRAVDEDLYERWYDYQHTVLEEIAAYEQARQSNEKQRAFLTEKLVALTSTEAPGTEIQKVQDQIAALDSAPFVLAPFTD